MKVKPAVLAEMIDKTIYAVSMDETRYHLNGVYLETKKEDGALIYRMVATDGHRLSLIDRKVDNSASTVNTSGVIVPRKGLHEIRKDFRWR